MTLTETTDDEMFVDPSQRLELAPPRTPNGLLAISLAFCLVIGGTAFWIGWIDEALPPQILGGIFLGLGALVLWGWIRTHNRLKQSGAHPFVFSPDGFSYQGTNGKLVPWHMVTGYTVTSVKTVDMLGIGLTEAGQDIIGRSPIMKKVSAMGDSIMGPQSIAIPEPIAPIPVLELAVIFAVYIIEHSTPEVAAEIRAEIEASGEVEAA